MKKLISIVLMVCMIAGGSVMLGTGEASAAGPTYWLKVNRRANVVNVYKKTDGKWKIYRVMLCSTGKNNGTPTGNYKVARKWKWQPLYGGHYGYYTTQFYRDFLFHSVYYSTSGKHNSLVNKEYNKLGRQASLGCVRLCAMDAKWIYENCGRGTKVTVYADKNPGPLGKPEGFKLKGSTGWDPTDPSSGNPNFMMKGPKISISKTKKKVITEGAKYSLKKGVTAKSPYTFEDLTSKVKVYRIYKKNSAGKYVKLKSTKLNTSKPGKYKIKYSCFDRYCGKKTVYKSFYLTIEKKPAPVPDDGDQPEADPGTNPGTNPGADPGMNPGAESGTNPGAESGTESETDPGQGSSPDAGSEAGDDNNTETQPGGSEGVTGGE